VSILIVEKSEQDRKQYEFLLNLGGHMDLIFICDLDEMNHYISTDFSHSNKIDLILIDIFEQSEDAIATLKKIKSSWHFQDIPIIVVTRNTQMDDMFHVFEAGAMDYIIKPLADKLELIPRINMALRLKSETDTRKEREKELLEMTKLLKESNTKLHQAYDKLEKIALTDSLTEIANRRHFDEIYKKEWTRAQRMKESISIILIDIDYFKKYNDTYGHQKGDECLRKVAGVLQTTVNRSSDLVARYGGEEFIILLADTEADGAGTVAGNIKRKIAALAIEHNASDISPHLTLSMGCSFLIPHTDIHRDKLIHAADQALYQSKESGRNSFNLYEDTLTV